MSEHHDLTHKIEQAVIDIFEENNNRPLEVPEIISMVERKLGDGEINQELTKQVIEAMQDRFILFLLPSGKLVLKD